MTVDGRTGTFRHHPPAMKTNRNISNVRAAANSGRCVMLVALRGQWPVIGLKHSFIEREKKIE